MGKKSNKNSTGSEWLAPLFCSIVAWFLVVFILLYTETVRTTMQAGIIGSFASCAVFGVWFQGHNAKARDMKVRTLFRRTSETYTRLKQSLRKKKVAKLEDGSRSVSNSSCVADAGCLSGAIIDAVRKGDAKAIERWITANNVDSREKESGSTMLHYAALEDQSRVARILLKASANPCVTDAEGNSPLHIAAAQGSAIIVKYLCEHGADPYALNEKNEGFNTRTTPMDLAEEFDNHGCALIMERAVRMNSAKLGVAGLNGGTPRRRASPVPHNV